MARADEELDRIRDEYSNVEIDEDNAEKLRRLENESSENENFDSYLAQIREKQKARAADDVGPRQPSRSSGGSTFDAWGGGEMDWYRDSLAQTAAESKRLAEENRAKGDALYSTLMQRSQQGLAVDRNTPAIRQQADVNAANEERAKREYLNDLAERRGPTANLLGEERLATERLGQRTGTFEAGLIGNELEARRQEIAQALAGMAGMLSADKVAGLQRELALLDQAIKEKGVSLTARGQDMNQDQFMRDLALREWDRANYWDYTRTYGT